MDVADLLVALDVEGANLLAGGRTDGLLEISVQALPSGLSLIGDAIVVVKTLGLVSRLVLLIEGGQGVGELRADTVLVVECDGLLNGVVADHVTVREVLGNDARAGLVFLRDLVVV